MLPKTNSHTVPSCRLDFYACSCYRAENWARKGMKDKEKDGDEEKRQRRGAQRKLGGERAKTRDEKSL